MGKGRKKKQHSIGHANFATNRVRRIKMEIRKTERKMEKLLRLFREGKQRSSGDAVRKIQGIKEGSQRHKNLQSHISVLRGKLV
jgi:hypothetical protein